MFKWWNILALTLLTGLVSNCAVFWSSEPEKSPKPSDTVAAEKAVSKSDKDISDSSPAKEFQHHQQQSRQKQHLKPRRHKSRNRLV
jgi:hypothetical protein